MAYRIDADEDVREAITRRAGEQLDKAIAALSEELEADPVRAVHSARKSVKKTRALLRLGRGALPRKQRARDNATLRDAARELSDAREAEVNIETLDELADRFAGRVPQTTLDAVRSGLEQARDAERELLVARTRGSGAVQELGAVRARVDDWRFADSGWKALEPGLRRTYRRGRRAFSSARRRPSTESLHEWRKRVKDLWYDARLLAPAGGPSVAGLAKEADHLADLLGDDHDLGVLELALHRLEHDIPADIALLWELLVHRRQQLQAEAMQVGARLYAERPKAFSRRMRRCWKAGRRAIAAVPELRPDELAAVG